MNRFFILFPFSYQFTTLVWTSCIVELVVLLVVISSGASLSVWKDAERKTALWERRRGRWKEEMKFDWQGVQKWVTPPAPWIWSCRPILGSGDTGVCVLRAHTCTLVCTWLNPTVEVTISLLLVVCVCVGGKWKYSGDRTTTQKPDLNADMFLHSLSLSEVPGFTTTALQITQFL